MMREVEFADLSEELQDRLSKYEIELHDMEWELKLHRFVALIVLGWVLERFLRWVF